MNSAEFKSLKKGDLIQFAGPSHPDNAGTWEVRLVAKSGRVRTRRTSDGKKGSCITPALWKFAPPPVPSNAHKRVTIKPSTYRGKEGYTVNSGRGINCFCPTREQADAYKALLKSDVSREEHERRSYEILCGKKS
jgi:hypothetical protein